MPNITVPSCAEVIINAGGWDEANNLINTIRRNIALVPETSSFMQTEMFIRSAPDVIEALWKCLSRCTYNGSKITKQTFEPVETRQDYEAIVEACIDENKRPFSQTPNLMFLGAVVQLKETQSQSSIQKPE